MDEKRSSKKREKRRKRNKAKAICRETGDHVHYPPTRPPKSTRPRHAPSPILESIFQLARKSRYGECVKNQASGIGTTAYDGCGEFVSATAGEDSMNCAACGCHRSFHREESLSGGILEELNLTPHQFRQIFCSPYGERKDEGKKRIVMDRSGGDDLVEEGEGRVKRLKTKFTAEQTEKMRNYAEKLRWKVSPESREAVEKFCVEIGVNRKKIMVWMNNHKDKN
ncbi:hypothetical protein EUTSA_v10009416mg [Eutrema salsugineum]|uniref:ZF-HD dimerization-type domain-containing protein n=1 Tax=Eutrema salsugineum TaxID=72664 RepID=V4KU33_EUTSA|nr:zinc-finger homeodomain protein 13 [Eutrema salsugineum]ESQ34829.1 hypothetical protein EUTSA_v10009416mg [Eutrema salsugineum]